MRALGRSPRAWALLEIVSLGRSQGWAREEEILLVLTGGLLPKFGLRMLCLSWVYGGKRKLKEIGVASRHLIDELIGNRICVITFSKTEYGQFS